METVFLGAIASATVIMATLQIAMVVYGVRLAKRVDRLVVEVETELKPALGRVNKMSGDLNRVTSLAVAQVERADELFKLVTERVDRITMLAQDTVVEPVKQGSALLQGFRVALNVLRGAERVAPSRGRRPVGDDEEGHCQVDEKRA